MNAAREKNRGAMPETAARVDELRAVFGPVLLLWTSENGGYVSGRHVSRDLVAVPAAVALGRQVARS